MIKDTKTGTIYQSKQQKWATFWSNVFLVISVFLCLILLSISLILSPRIVVGSSMYPTLNYSNTGNGDIVYIIKERNYVKGDIVVLHSSTGLGADVIKRVIGSHGDTIEIKNDLGNYYVYVNNVKLEENYISANSMQSCYTKFQTYLTNHGIEDGKLIVGENEVFILGDNRNNSYDSSNYGCRDISEIDGRVFLIVPADKTIFSAQIIW